MTESVFPNNKFERFCRVWLLSGVFVFVTSFFWASGTAPLRNIFYLAIVLPVLFILPWRSFSFQEYGGYFTLSALVFAGYSVLSSLWSVAPDMGRYVKILLFLMVWLGGLAWLFSNVAFSSQRLYQVIVGGGVVGAALTVFLFYSLHGYHSSFRMTGQGLVENPTVVAQLFGVPALLAYILLLRAPTQSARFLLLTSMLVCLAPVFLSQTRGAMVAWLVSAIFALIATRPKFIIWLLHLILVVVSLALVSLVIDWDLIFQQRGTILSYRDVIWLEVLSRVAENILFGIGIEHKALITIEGQGVFEHSHNSWLDILYYSGLIGVVLAIWHVLLLFKSAVLTDDELPLVAWLLFGCICLFTNGSHLLTAPDAQWWVYWVPAALLAAQITRRRLCQKS